MFFKRYLNLLIKITLILISFNIKYLNLSALASYKSEKNEDKLDISKKKLIKSPYLIDTGDGFFIEFLGLDIFSRRYYVTRNGSLILPEIGEIYVKGLTARELKELLIKKYDDFIINPDINVFQVAFRPIQIYIIGEIKNPGFYTFDGTLNAKEDRKLSFNTLSQLNLNQSFGANITQDFYISPTVFDALKKSKGVTNYADLSNVKVIRQNSKSSGGGKIETSLNILEMILNGDQSQNINLQDDDTIIIPRSKKLVKDQIFAINQSNLTPSEIRVYISGNVKLPGRTIILKGSSLIEAIIVAGGQRSFTGNIEIIRFNDKGNYKKRVIKYDQTYAKGSSNNPILSDGDIIHVRQNLLGKSTKVLTEVGSPIVTGIGLYKIFNFD